MIKQIKAVIDGNGNVTMEGIGFQGMACNKAMAELEQALGREISRENKPEYDSLTSVDESQTIGL